MSKNISIADIASALHLSKTTVSFILNGRAEEKRISDKVVKRVLAYVEEVGYRPNSLAKSLRTGKSNTIGLMVEDISGPFFASIARLIEDRAYENGYKIIYCSTDNNTAKTHDLIGMFRDRHVDGYIIAPPPGIENDIAELLKNDLPVILFDRYLPLIDTDHVIVDNQFGTYNATRHLIEQGYKNIAYITFASTQTQMTDRMLGYHKAIDEHKLKPNVKEIVFNRNDAEVIEPLTHFLQENKHLDAVLFGTDHIGTCGLKVINKLGLRVPNDLAVASFDDYSVFELYTCPVTAVAQPITAIADSIITLLLARLNAKTKAPVQKITLSTELIVRSSSKAK
ncbi:LacI family DNA-binding transcriptional regulator [Mucilaginibacter gynuensis]|uniref:LacI family DNA-binding transcriptional regulator n=1 Tax=Mucilaginibacter gynuensis TaxID=1302236 RepID=A0ABP8G0F3_9SPHI